MQSQSTNEGGPMQAQTRRRGAAPTSIRNAITAMYIGAALTLIAAIVPLIDLATVDNLTQQLQNTYPAYSPSQINADRYAILVYLFTVSGIGIVLWLWMAWAVNRRKRWARVVSTVVFALATVVSLVSFYIPAPLFVTLAGLPCLAGLAAVVFLWIRGSSAYFTETNTAIKSELAHS